MSDAESMQRLLLSILQSTAFNTTEIFSNEKIFQSVENWCCCWFSCSVSQLQKFPPWLLPCCGEGERELRQRDLVLLAGSPILDRSVGTDLAQVLQFLTDVFYLEPGLNRRCMLQSRNLPAWLWVYVHKIVTVGQPGYVPAIASVAPLDPKSKICPGQTFPFFALELVAAGKSWYIQYSFDCKPRLTKFFSSFHAACNQRRLVFFIAFPYRKV